MSSRSNNGALRSLEDYAAHPVLFCFTECYTMISDTILYIAKNRAPSRITGHNGTSAHNYEFNRAEHTLAFKSGNVYTRAQVLTVCIRSAPHENV